MGLARVCGSGGGDAGDGQAFLSPQVRVCSEPPLQITSFPETALGIISDFKSQEYPLYTISGIAVLNF